MLSDGPIVFATGGDAVNQAEYSVPDCRIVGGFHLQVNPELAQPRGQRGVIRRVQKHLGGDTTVVQAGTAEYAAIDDGDSLVLPIGGHKSVARPRADNDQIIVRFFSHTSESIGVPGPGSPGLLWAKV